MRSPSPGYLPRSKRRAPTRNTGPLKQCERLNCYSTYSFNVRQTGQLSSWERDDEDEDVDEEHVGSSARSEEHGEDASAAETGSAGSLDRLRDDVNLLSINMPIGFMSKVSEVSWIRRLIEEIHSEGGDMSDLEKLGKGLLTTS